MRPFVAVRLTLVATARLTRIAVARPTLIAATALPMIVGWAACADDSRLRAVSEYAADLDEWSREVHAYLKRQQEDLELADLAISDLCELADISLAECPTMIAEVQPLPAPPPFPPDVPDRDLARELTAWTQAYSAWSAEVNDFVADLESRTDELSVGIRSVCETVGGEEGCALTGDSARHLPHGEVALPPP